MFTTVLGCWVYFLLHLHSILITLTTIYLDYMWKNGAYPNLLGTKRLCCYCICGEMARFWRGRHVNWSNIIIHCCIRVVKKYLNCR
uniref:Uncharacterized protein n=1 Tax=Arundo donax TaxID=35708 RepID=A0A0A9DH62_ARUDO